MKPLHLLEFVFSQLLRRRERTLLSIIAIAMGIFTIVVLTSVSNGVSEELRSSLKGFGANTILIIPLQLDNAFSSFGSASMSTQGRFYESDAKKLKGLAGVKTTGVSLSGRSTVIFQDEAKTATIYAVEVSGFRDFSSDLEVEQGRWLTENSYEVVLGSKIPEIFDKKPKAGKTIIIDGQTFKIAGILKETGNSLSNLDNIILMPYEQGKILYKKNFGKDEVSAIRVGVAEGYSTKEIAENVENYLMKIKKITNEKDKFFTAITSEFIQESINKIKALIDMFFLGVGSIAIAVGVIGIGNSIYMAVIERTKEIGTLRALGMQKKEVLLAFIFEGVLLSIAGSILGLIVGIIISIALSAILPSKVNIEMSIAALFVVIAGSLVASYFPAKKASSIYPAEALVYE